MANAPSREPQPPRREEHRPDPAREHDQDSDPPRTAVPPGQPGQRDANRQDDL